MSKRIDYILWMVTMVFMGNMMAAVVTWGIFYQNIGIRKSIVLILLNIIFILSGYKLAEVEKK